MSGCGGCDKCGGAGCRPVVPRPPPGAGPDGELPPGALYVFQKNVIVAKGQPEQSVFTLPPAAAVDVFIRYRSPTTNIDPDGATRFSIYATQKLVSYLVDRNASGNVSDTNMRVLAVRDLPVNGYEVKVDGVNIIDAGGSFFDVVAIGWGKEPTAIGPLPLSQWIDGADVPPDGRNVGLPLLAVLQDDTIAVIGAGGVLPHNPAAGPADLNVLPMAVFLAAPPVRANGQAGPLLSDSAGNLKVASVPVAPTAGNRFTSVAYEASHVSAGAKALRAAFVSSKAAAAGFLFVYDLAALPANGTLPDFPPIPIPVGPAFVSLDLAEERAMANGVVLAFSSTQATLTIGTADCWFEGHIA